MVEFLSVVIDKEVLVREFDFSVFGKESEDRDKTCCITSAVVCEVDDDILYFIMFLDIFEACIRVRKYI